MTPEQFWGLIQSAGGHCRENGTNIEKEIERGLARIPADEIAAFDGLMRAYLWVAMECVIRRTDAHLCEGFHHLLVASGQEAFLAAVSDPAAAVVGHDGKDGPEEFLHVAAPRAYFKKTGRNLSGWDVRGDSRDYTCQFY